MRQSGAPDDPPDPVDSGYRLEELEAILTDLLVMATTEEREDPFTVALGIGLLDVDVIETRGGTVMLTLPRAVLDARVAAIKDALQRGAALSVAISEAREVHPGPWEARPG